jgi:hypothetical protein
VNAYYHAVRRTAKRIARAINASVVALQEGRVAQEPAMTDRMLGAIEGSLDGFSVNGIRWHAKTLTDRGAKSEESKFGADFIGVLNIALPDFVVNKGFLAQAKLVRDGDVGSLRTLREQCEKMLVLTPHAYVFLYSETGVTVVPALSAVSTKASPVELYKRSAQRFFEEHLECFIGDRSIHAPTADMLNRLREQADARRALLIQAREC